MSENQTVRVVAGTSRGHPLVAPQGQQTRPTSDRVREAMFNALGSLDVVEGAGVLDLFAGSGALGIEALSRGAARCTFVDQERRAIDAIRTNVAATGVADRTDIVTSDVLRYLAGTGAGGDIDLVLADPPYAFDQWDDVMASIAVTVGGGILVIESDREIDLPSTWSCVRQKRYGTTLVLIARRTPDQALQATLPHPTE